MATPKAIRYGPPDVTGLRSDLIRQWGTPYLERHFITSRTRYHHILSSDTADMHDHPWDFTSIILAGSYIETTADGDVEHQQGAVIHRKAEQLHKLTLPDGPVWTHVTVGPVRRRWGFLTPTGWVHWSYYLRT